MEKAERSLLMEQGTAERIFFKAQKEAKLMCRGLLADPAIEDKLKHLALNRLPKQAVVYNCNPKPTNHQPGNPKQQASWQPASNSASYPKSSHQHAQIPIKPNKPQLPTSTLNQAGYPPKPTAKTRVLQRQPLPPEPKISWFRPFAINASPSFSENLSGSLMDSMSGNLSGNRPGNLSGSLSGNLPSNMSGSLPGNMPTTTVQQVGQQLPPLPVTPNRPTSNYQRPITAQTRNHKPNQKTTTNSLPSGANKSQLPTTIEILNRVTGNVQKSWHLEAIKALTRSQYAQLKHPMLKLSNSSLNIHPNDLLIKLTNPTNLPPCQLPQTDQSRGPQDWHMIQEGSFGTVYFGYVHMKGNAAVKVPSEAMMRQDPYSLMLRYINEWDILAKCDHPNIVRILGGVILGVFDLWLCTELVIGHDLHSLKYSQSCSRAIPQAASLRMCRQLANAVSYLHTPIEGKGIVVHRDIKPENVIIDREWNIRLCDFGDAIETEDGLVESASGATWLYAPPELLIRWASEFDYSPDSGTLPCYLGYGGGLSDPSGLGRLGKLDELGNRSDISDASKQPKTSEDVRGKEFPQLSEKWDIWSVGCVFLEMFGLPGPFHHLVKPSDPPNVICQKMAEKAVSGLVPQIPMPIRGTRVGKLIARCLDRDPMSRPRADDLVRELSVPDVELLAGSQRTANNELVRVSS